MKDFLHNELFWGIRLIDLFDYGLIALAVYQLYKILKGSLAFSILLGLITLMIIWIVVDYFEMMLLSRIFSFFIKFAPLALLIVFQQEVRKFLLMLGKNSWLNDRVSFKNILPWKWDREEPNHTNFEVVMECCDEMALTKTGAIIVFANTSELKFVASRGEEIDANVTKHLIQSIFSKASPLHDGAVIIANNKIKAAGTVLPVSENPDLPVNIGLRHKAAVGISEQSDAVVVVVSEQTGRISVAHGGQLFLDVGTKFALEMLHNEFPNNDTVNAEAQAN